MREEKKMSPDRTVLVTGGAGFVGSHIALELIDAGYRVVIVDDLRTGLRSLIPPAAQLFEVDLRKTAEVAAILRDCNVDAVIHCAASTVVPESVSDPLNYYHNNLGSTISLLQSMRDSSVRKLIFSSTAAVYAAQSDKPIDESAPTVPCSPYGASKLMAERIIQDLAAAGAVEYTILRYFNVAGADPGGRSGQSTPAATHLIKVGCETILRKRQALTVYGTDWPTADGTGVRDYIHVTDLAKAHVMVLEGIEGPSHNRVFNCGYGQGFSVRDVIAALERAAGCQMEVIAAPRRPGDLAQVIADATALRSELDWRPHYASLDQMVADSLAWEAAQVD